MSERTGLHPSNILSEDIDRASDRDARSMNIAVGRAVADVVKSTLGPRGRDKMLADQGGGLAVTNDGDTVLSKMNIEHPAGKIVADVASTQKTEVSDGTTTAVILTGSLLEEAERLLDDGIHSTTIERGYHQAIDRVLELLPEITIDITTDSGILQEVAATAMTGKNVDVARDHLSSLVVEAVRTVDQRDSDDIVVEPVGSGTPKESELLEGVLIEEERIHDHMPYNIDDATVLVYGSDLTFDDAQSDPAIDITNPDQFETIIEEEERQFRDMAEEVSEADVVLVDGNVDDMVMHFLAEEGILAFDQVDREDQRAIVRATDAWVVSDLDELSHSDLGHVRSVERRIFGDDEYVAFTSDTDPGVVTLLLRSGTEHVGKEMEIALTDAVDAVEIALEERAVLPGGGASEIELARRLRSDADAIDGREQLAVEAFANALETIPRTLARTAGRDPIDVLTELRTRHAEGAIATGLDATTGDVAEMTARGVVEPLQVKNAAIDSAVDATVTIVRIDDMIAASNFNEPNTDILS